MSLIDLAILAYDTLREMSQQATSDHPEDNQPPTPITPLPAVVASKLAVMSTSSKGLIELANYEGLSNTIYLDTGGVRTIGIGMTVSEIKDIAQWPWNKRIETPECCSMFKDAVNNKYATAILKALKVKVTQNEFDALVSITYNIGVGGMAGSTFMRRLNAGAPPASVVEAMQWWNKDNGRTVNGLTIRRKAEGAVFLSNAYLNNGTVPFIIPDIVTHKEYNAGRVNITQYI